MDTQPINTAARPPRRIVLTGATGYIGGRLAPRLLAAGHRVRCLVRSERKLRARAWSSDPALEVVEIDLEKVDRLAEAMAGCDAAYYLIHSMEAAGRVYADRDRQLAAAFAAAAGRAGVQRLVYLGGLGEMGDGLSEHLRSRREVEAVLAAGPVPVTTLRAAMIIGSGSVSFEILRYLVERLPVMVTPRWVSTESQPIAVRNVLHYLAACLDVPETIGATLDIGGRDVLTYRQLMQIMAESLGVSRRLILPIPLLTPRLSSLWIHLVTPLSFRIARPLAEGLRNRVVCRDHRAHRLMPQPLLTAREAIDVAVGRTREAEVATAWSDAGVLPGDPDWAGGKCFIDARDTEIGAPAQATFDAICHVGGGHGYYAADLLWRIRGALDRLVGGPGLRRGRRHPAALAYGDALDFWRVVGIEPSRMLRLRAEMKLPGEAELEFFVTEGSAPTANASDNCRLAQIARFKPRGLTGLAYWYAVLPLHHFVFSGMLRGIRRAAEGASGASRADAVEGRRP